MLRLGWFSTGRDKAAIDLLDVVFKDIEKGNMKATISFVFCNREKGEDRESDQFINFVEQKGLPLVTFSSRKFKRDLFVLGKEEERRGNNEKIIKWRNEFDTEVLNRIEAFDVDLDVLAGYMLIVGEEMCRKRKMINLHPALPGVYKGSWEQVVESIIKNKNSEGGINIHLVTPDLDAGPPITYSKFSLWNEDLIPLWKMADEGVIEPLFWKIREEGLKREMPLLIHTLRLLSEGILRIETSAKITYQGIEVKGGILLKDEILFSP